MMTLTCQSFVSIAVPVLNEEQYIRPCLASLLEQVEEDTCEILVLDGGSSDATVAIATEMAIRHPCIRLVENPQRIQAAAINLAARIAAPQAIMLVRADAHALYPQGFLSACLKAMQESGAQSVVTSMYAAGRDGFQRAVAAALNSRLGNGGSPHRVGRNASGFVDHGHHAVFDRQFFLDRGGYDESFTHNEDAEYDHRVHLAGGRVWMCTDFPLVYFPRGDLVSLVRQYLRYGRGRALTLITHRIWPKPRQLGPLFIFAGVVGGLMLMPLSPWFGLVPLAYLLLCLGWGAAAAMTNRDVWLLAMGPAAMAMHLSWGAGFLRTVCGYCYGKLSDLGRRRKIQISLARLRGRANAGATGPGRRRGA
jgi:succinoglycan biosynthesis protein ExoA